MQDTYVKTKLKNLSHQQYVPNMTPELRSYLSSKGTLNKFILDYNHLCSSFMPAKIYVPGKEDKPKNFSELDSFEKVELEKAGKRYAHALHHLLEMGLKLNKENKKYAVVGGMGVLGHLYAHNKKFAHKWRGTDDIDVLAKDELGEVYKGMGLAKMTGQEKVDTSMIPDGRLFTYYKENPWSDKPLKIQQRRTVSFPGLPNRDVSSQILKEAKTVNMYGVPISVASREHLIESKTNIRTRKDKFGHMKDAHDVEHLRSVSHLEQILSKN